jgi:hypothetical protein
MADISMAGRNGSLGWQTFLNGKMVMQNSAPPSQLAWGHFAANGSETDRR